MSSIPLKYVGKVTLTLIRSASGSYINGLWVNGAESNPIIEANVQPVVGVDVKNLPEGKRDRRSVVLYTASLLKEADESSQTQSDRFTYDGDIFEVVRVQKWNMGVRDHYKGYACRLDE